MEKFVEGEVVLYQNGDCFELGVVKRVCDNGDCFVWYHTGDTAARTPSCYLHKLTNSYAFAITRLSCDSTPVKMSKNNMSKDRLREIIDNVLDWGAEHEEEFRECLIDAMDLTEEEIKELRLEDYICEDDEEEEEEE